MLTAPVTVTKEERSLSKLKLIRKYLRTTNADSRLETLLLLSSEKDNMDSIDLKKWATECKNSLSTRYFLTTPFPLSEIEGDVLSGRPNCRVI